METPVGNVGKEVISNDPIATCNLLAHCYTIEIWSLWEFSAPILIVPVWSKDPVFIGYISDM